MATWPVRNEIDRNNLRKAIDSRKPPFTATLTKGAPRSIEQNRLQRLWLREAEEQGDMSAEEYRAHCKAHIGIPILLAENEAFRNQYNRIIRPLPYQQKLDLMSAPIDFPVTRIMTSAQKAKYLDRMHRHFSSLGMVLTDPG